MAYLAYLRCGRLCLFGDDLCTSAAINAAVCLFTSLQVPSPDSLTTPSTETPGPRPSVQVTATQCNSSIQFSH